MKTITMLEFRQQAEAIVREIESGGTFLLTYRGNPVAELSPVIRNKRPDKNDPFFSLSEHACDLGESLSSADADALIYG